MCKCSVYKNTVPSFQNLPCHKSDRGNVIPSQSHERPRTSWGWECGTSARCALLESPRWLPDGAKPVETCRLDQTLPPLPALSEPSTSQGQGPSSSGTLSSSRLVPPSSSLLSRLPPRPALPGPGQPSLGQELRCSGPPTAFLPAAHRLSKCVPRPPGFTRRTEASQGSWESHSQTQA